MSSRYNIKNIPGHSVPQLDGADIPDDFSFPSCTIEDVDRAIFKLFDKDIPLVYEAAGEIKKIPVIYATGERFAILRRKQPLRDRSGALIIPLISISRTGISRDVARGKGIGPGDGSITIKKRISSRNPAYQRLQNRLALKNQANAGAVNPHNGQPSLRNGRGTATDITISNDSPENIYEIITINNPKFYTATYEVTLWAQYTQQMNDILTAVITSATQKNTYRIESDNGYWFTAFVDAAFSPDTNVDDFSDDERLIKYNFSIDVNGYLLNNDLPGVQSGIRRYYSAPSISFENTFAANDEAFAGGPVASNPDAHILEDFSHILDPIPADRIGGGKGSSGVGPQAEGVTIGGFVKASDGIIGILETDPLTGKQERKMVKIKTKNRRHGETVYREIRNLGK